MSSVAQVIRVAVANKPRMIRDVIATRLATEKGIEVAQISDEAEISRVIEKTKPEFLIVSLDSRRFGRSEREDVLQRHPEIQIMALAGDGNSFTLFSASDGIRSVTYKAAEADILDVMRSNSHRREGAL
jgi:DNA-binding NarL/FixJ family response regulator